MWKRLTGRCDELWIGFADWERVQHVMHMLDVRLALVTAERALEAVKEIEALEETRRLQDEELSLTERERLAALERIRNAAVHPQTGQVILTPLRLSMIVPVNMMLDAIMLSATSPAQVVVAQWLNQSYNAMHYYANRNTTNTETLSQRTGAYIAATGSSVCVALALKSGRVPMLRKFAPFLAVAAADVMNLSIMRKSEFVEGITVQDCDTLEPVGRSCRAGMLATGSCIVARVAAAFPILAGTPLLMEQLDKRTMLFQRLPWLRFPVMITTVGVMIQLAVPVTFGMFHQNMIVSASLLEPEIACRSKRVFFNKGL